MATSPVLLLPGNAILPDGSANNLAPAYKVLKGSQTAAVFIPVLGFDSAGGLEGCWWEFPLPTDYLSGGTLVIFWLYNSVTAGNVKWQATLGAITPADADTPLEHAQAAAATVTTAINATEARRLLMSSITLTMDSAAAEDWINLRLFRDSADAADTAAAVDADVMGCLFKYTS